MAKVFYIDLKKCTGCRNCQVACKDEHCGNSWLPYAAEQPEIGQFRYTVHKQNIVRFDIPVGESRGMDGLDSGKNSGDD